jgi:hypothetical protein
VSPQVTGRDGAGDTEILPGHGDCGSHVSQVKQGNSIAAVVVVSEPDL